MVAVGVTAKLANAQLRSVPTQLIASDITCSYFAAIVSLSKREQPFWIPQAAVDEVRMYARVHARSTHAHTCSPLSARSQDMKSAYHAALGKVREPRHTMQRAS